MKLNITRITVASGIILVLLIASIVISIPIVFTTHALGRCFFTIIIAVGHGVCLFILWNVFSDIYTGDDVSSVRMGAAGFAMACLTIPVDLMLYTVRNVTHPNLLATMHWLQLPKAVLVLIIALGLVLDARLCHRFNQQYGDDLSLAEFVTCYRAGGGD